MPTSLLRAGMAALRDPLGAVAALKGSAGTPSDDGFIPTSSGWLIAPGGWALDSISDVRRLLFWLAACVMLVILVSVTNPTETSFRAHLTELAFRRHLAHIRSSDEPETAVADGARTPQSNGSSGADTPPIAPFRFANHVAITLRTPNLYYRSYFLFAIAFSAAPGPPAFLSDPVPAKSAKHGVPQPEPSLAYLGVLGHWLVLGHVPPILQWAWRVIRVGRRGKARKKSAALDRPGVLEMRAVLPKDESPTSRASSLVPKLLFKNDSHKDLTDLLPLHSTPSTLPDRSSLGPESRRGSVVNLHAPPPVVQSEPQDLSSPVLTALKAELATAQSVLADLQAQLIAHNESVAASQAHLQSTVEDLRQRRKDDDAERQDLKSKAKTLEDQKRQAEGARRESDKRLKAAESIRDGIQSKIAAVLGEIEDLKGNMKQSEKNLKIVHAEGKQYVLDTRKAVEDKTKELAKLETEVVELESANDTLFQQVRDAEDRLKTAEAAAEEARKMAPEEEMMLMAAAYEAAASETYHHGQRQNQADNQWASQAAAYMAEAGFPHLDQSYTARPPTTSGGYGHLARQATPVFRNHDKTTPPPGTNLAVNTSTAVPEKLADVPGFEDFGPGTLRSLARPTPHLEEPEDQGSPSGPISASFPNSWLPQGLVRSLEGDITPLEGASEIAPSDDEGVLFSFPPNDAPNGSSSPGADSGSDSGGDSPYWPANHSSEDGSRQSHRRVTPQRFSPHMGSNSTLPNMGNAQSRRWFSTSPSSENVSSSFNLFPGSGVGSSDSLPLAGFESPFAPSASEKRALKWPLLGKARWGSTNGNGMSGLEEITAGLRDTAYNGTSGNNVLNAEELFNRVPASPTAANFGPWLSHPPAHNGHEDVEEALVDDNHRVPERKPSFGRFFSLRKGQ